MIKIDIAPLSVNKAWQGRRFKTPAYKQYEEEVLWLLPKIKMPEAPYCLHLVFSFSNKASDIDNPTKLVLDIMQKKYGFNDSSIYKLIIEKKIVKKGKECFQFNLTTI
jgi:Holliday junction resolvase RusA-like endonuclease